MIESDHESTKSVVLGAAGQMKPCQQKATVTGTEIIIFITEKGLPTCHFDFSDNLNFI
jgi:hypothetical protein